MLLLKINGHPRLKMKADQNAIVCINYKKEFPMSRIPDTLEEYNEETGSLVSMIVSEDEDFFYIRVPEFGVNTVLRKENFNARRSSYLNGSQPFLHLRLIEYLEMNNLEI